MSNESISEDSISILTPEQQLINRLDDDFNYLLHFSIKSIAKLPEWKKELANKWIMKLSTSTEYLNIATKLTRNDYITKLLSCIHNQDFKPPFNQSPPSTEALTKIDFDFEKVVHDIPAWINELRHREARETKIGGRDFETYFAAKLLDNGACAYLAVSTQNEGDKSAWMRLAPNAMNKEKIDEIFNKEFRGTGFDKDF
ncbi:hypothetical protein PVAND_011067 [Polypedilum vanderplanki]|uniref:DUF4485 domain-containing protein n=1 Tax=Polypedilum vanderplanki TaxID=319348 RepID=A0A9J6CHZ8_POLVA|nr:hypothetical protein PVAND_011067 [Polypedilum vanderplanki]